MGNNADSLRMAAAAVYLTAALLSAMYGVIEHWTVRVAALSAIARHGDVNLIGPSDAAFRSPLLIRESGSSSNFDSALIRIGEA